jgi:predicted GIY-YIG superfamily endonuclease
MSLRIKIVFALVVSSLVAAVAVGLIARWMVTRHLSDELIERAFSRYRSDVVAYYETYGSWEEAVRREHMIAFVRRRRGPSLVDTRSPA